MKESKKEDINQLYQRIIVPVDGSDLSKKAAQVGNLFAQKMSKTLIFFHVKEIPATAMPPGEVTYAPDLSETLEKQAESILKEITEMFSNEEINIQTEMAEGIAHNEIIEFANPDDLIIMGSKGHSAIERILIGSTSENVLHHADSSVLIVR